MEPFPHLFWRLDSTDLNLTNLSVGNTANVRDRYEIMAHISEPRSRALGRVTGNVAGFQPSNDLQAIWGSSGDAHRTREWHSGQFRFSVAAQNSFWRRLMVTFQLAAE